MRPGIFRAHIFAEQGYGILILRVSDDGCHSRESGNPLMPWRLRIQNVWSGTVADVRTISASIREVFSAATGATSACSQRTCRNWIGGGVRRGMQAVLAETGSNQRQFPAFRSAGR
jgi:hypothetical protein